MSADVSLGVVQAEAELARQVGGALDHGAVRIVQLKYELAVYQSLILQRLGAGKLHRCSTLGIVGVDKVQRSHGLAAIRNGSGCGDAALAVVGNYHGDLVLGCAVSDAVDGLATVLFGNYIIMLADLRSSIGKIEAEHTITVGNNSHRIAGNCEGFISSIQLKGKHSVGQSLVLQHLRAIYTNRGITGDRINIDKIHTCLGDTVAVIHMDSGMELTQQVIGDFHYNTEDTVIIGYAIDGLAAVDFLDQIMPSAYLIIGNGRE